MATQWPLVAARLVELLPTLPHWAGVDVKYGAVYDSSAATFVTVGHATDGTTTQAGSYTKTQSTDGFSYIEQGSVACQITTTIDGPDITALRTSIFVLLDDIEDAIRADRTLAVLSQEGTTELSVDISSTQLVPGAAMTLAFSVDYYTVT